MTEPDRRPFYDAITDLQLFPTERSLPDIELLTILHEQLWPSPELREQTLTPLYLIVAHRPVIDVKAWVTSAALRFCKDVASRVLLYCGCPQEGAACAEAKTLQEARSALYEARQVLLQYVDNADDAFALHSSSKHTLNRLRLLDERNDNLAEDSAARQLNARHSDPGAALRANTWSVKSEQLLVTHEALTSALEAYTQELTDGPEISGHAFCSTLISCLDALQKVDDGDLPGPLGVGLAGMQLGRAHRSAHDVYQLDEDRDLLHPLVAQVYLGAYADVGCGVLATPESN